MADALSDQISYLIAGAGWRLEAQIRESAGSSSLPFEQWRVLALLVERNGRSMTDLAQHAFVEPPTLTKMVDRMVSDALVYRVPDTADRRRILIFLSERGRQRFDRLHGPVADWEEIVGRRLGRQGKAALKALLHELSETEIGPVEATAVPRRTEAVAVGVKA